MSHKKSSAQLEAVLRKKLAAKPGLFELLKPEWPVGCKRLGASPGYLEAIIQDNVDIITSGIERVTTTGILDKNGVERQVDAIICATGFDT